MVEYLIGASPVGGNLSRQSDDARSWIYARTGMIAKLVNFALTQRALVCRLGILDAARTPRTIQQKYIEALFNYQHNLFRLESAVRQEIAS